MTTWHTQDKTAVLNKLGSSAEKGLSSQDAASVLEEHGPNELKEQKSRSPWKMLLDQFIETMVLILIVAAIISGFLGETTEMIAIAAIVVLFALLGFIQEYRAEKAMAALKQMSVPLVQALRDGKVKEISARELVPGDVIMLEAGNIVPADARIVNTANLKVQEAALTGEAEAVDKLEKTLSEPDMPLGDRVNMVYMGTTVTYGRGEAVVVETGMETELGKIAGMIQGVKSKKTPLQDRLSQLGKSLAIFGGIAAVIIGLVGILRGESLSDMFLVAISVAVAVVPEGLPAVVTITLALGSQKMLKRNALVRKLPAVETLGSVTVICSDKTGTLTENKMAVTVLETAGKKLSLPQDVQAGGTEKMLPYWIGLLCNDARETETTDGGAIGDPTETALVIAAANAGLHKADIESILPRVSEVPFDSERMRMSTVHKVPEQNLPQELAPLKNSHFAVFSKGAVDSLLKVANKIWTEKGEQDLDPEWKDKILNANKELAENGIRVLGLAFRGLNGAKEIPSPDDVEHDLVFAGIVGLIDPPRAAVKPAVKACRTAGIKPIMITGDHPLTAAAIARDLNLADNVEFVSGEMLNKMSDEELEKVVKRISVFARVSPQDKLRIVGALQKQGEIVAMTGDGVNDSPALKKADIGVAMGITGTGVAKEAADMVLLDDNFSTIVASVEEGRSIFDNLLRFVKFSLGGNLGKVLVMLLAPFFGIVIALRPLQLLWLNLLTDGLMGLGLGMEPAEKDNMQRPPRKKDAPILDRPTLFHVSWTGILIATITLGVGLYYFNVGDPADNYWQTMIFATLGFTQIGHALGLRSTGHSPFSLTSNVLLSVLTVLTIALQLAVIYLPFMKEFFALVPLELEDLAISIILGAFPLIGVRLENYIRKSRATTESSTKFS